jgi:hypothetical protein
MKRLVAVTLALAVAPLFAQSPAGWKVRADNSQSASDPDGAGEIKFVKAGAGFHCTNPAAAVYWNPSNTAKGTYTVKGTFTLMKPSGHTNYYGIVFGGSARAKTPSDVVKKPDPATGKSTNDLEVRVGADKVDFVVNGTVVHSEPKTGALAKTDGIYGIRINHLLEVQVDNFGVSK